VVWAVVRQWTKSATRRGCGFRGSIDNVGVLPQGLVCRILGLALRRNVQEPAARSPPPPPPPPHRIAGEDDGDDGVDDDD
jgi:hypothetical protein